MLKEFEFLKDLPIWILGPKDTKPPESVLRAMAAVLDRTMVSSAFCEEYLRELVIVRKTHDFSGSEGDLQTLNENGIEELLARPFSQLPTEELRRIHIHRIAANPIAIDQLFEEFAQKPLTDEWLALEEEEADRVARRYGIGWGNPMAVAAQIDAKLGTHLASALAGNEEESGLLAGARGSSADDHTPESGKFKPVRVLRWHLAGDDKRCIRWERGNLADAHTTHLDVEITVEAPNRLRVRPSGIATMDPGCELRIRWLQVQGQVNVEATFREPVQDVLLANATQNLLSLQNLEIRFSREGPKPYTFVALIPLRQQEP